MKKEMKSVTYESPVTREMQVCLESGICGSSVIKDTDTKNVTTTEHEVDDFSDKGFSGSWDSHTLN